ncbi:MAG: hypothetical protein ACTSVZ_01105 [Promethearchaeota archaeon]
MIHHHYRRHGRSRFSPLVFGIFISVFFIVRLPIGMNSVITIVPILFTGVIFFLVVYLNNRNLARNQARFSNMPIDPDGGRNSEYSEHSEYSNYGSQPPISEPHRNAYASKSSTSKYCSYCGNQLYVPDMAGSSSNSYIYCQHCGEKNTN